MEHTREFYIDGKWVPPTTDATLDVINPTTEKPLATIAMGAAADVDAAVAAAKRAFTTFSRTTREERLDLLQEVMNQYKLRMDDLAQILHDEMGCPMPFASKVQIPSGYGHFKAASKVLQNYEFEVDQRTTRLRHEPVGVVGMITPWNWPQNQITCKVAPALATGCTMVLKPSEVAPLDAIVLAEILDAAGVPAGVFNLVNGDGPSVGAAMSSHPDIDMMSFTGSTRAGILVQKAAADSVKRVALELGGKSANIVLDDADFATVVRRDVKGMMSNSGQSCNAGTRMLVPNDRMDEVAEIARAAAESVTSAPEGEGMVIGPVVNQAQFDRIQGLIQSGIDEGATLTAGGTGRPDGVDTGYFVKPTVFTNATNDMRIAREEIFGPVMTIIGYDDEAEAIEIANDNPYGLSGYVNSGDIERARAVASQLRTGMVHLNGAPADIFAPFGGYKQSGNGREWGQLGFEEYLETKAVMGWTPRED